MSIFITNHKIVYWSACARQVRHLRPADDRGGVDARARDGDRRPPWGRITAVFTRPTWPRVFDADALGAFLDHARAMGMRVSDAGKWGRSRWSSRGFLTFGCLLCLAGRSFSASTVQHADGLKALRILAIERGRDSYWNATSAKLRSLRECKRSHSWDLSFSSAFKPISRCWPTRWR